MSLGSPGDSIVHRALAQDGERLGKERFIELSVGLRPCEKFSSLSGIEDAGILLYVEEPKRMK